MMDGEPETIDLLRDLEGTGDLAPRLRVPLWVAPDTADEPLEAWLRPARRARDAVARRRGEVLRRRRDRRGHRSWAAGSPTQRCRPGRHWADPSSRTQQVEPRDGSARASIGSGTSPSP